MKTLFAFFVMLVVIPFGVAGLFGLAFKMSESGEVGAFCVCFCGFSVCWRSPD